LNLNNQYHFEILAVIITAVFKFILMDWINLRAFYTFGVILFWLIYILYKVKTNPKSLHIWGFKKEHFKQTIIYLIPLILISIVISIIYGSYNSRLSFSWHFILIFLLYPCWGIIQQFMMLSIISHNLVAISELKINRYFIIFLVSILFSLIHYPSYSLMIFTFFLEMVFITVYLKWRNLWAIGLAHGWIATFILYFILNRDLWSELFARF